MDSESIASANPSALEPGRILVADCACAEFIAYLFGRYSGAPAVPFDTSDAMLAALRPGIDALVLCEVTTWPHRFDLLREVRKRDAEIPFLFVTTTEAPELIARARAEGAQGWVFKPFHWRWLYDALAPMRAAAGARVPLAFSFLTNDLARVADSSARPIRRVN